MESAVTAADGRTFAAAVVARALKAPVQLASVPDGRLLIADADARVRVLFPGEPGSEELALDARALMEPPPVGAIGLAAHPDFARNRLVYVAFVSLERSDTRLRVVRLREIANTLGEPATIFEATVVASPGLPGVPLSAMSQSSSLDGPRLAFGPDKLLYVLLPQGSRFSGEPAASQPVGAMLRLRDDGRAPADGALSGIAAHPLGFAWHPATDAMWGIVPTSDTAGVIRTLPDSDGLSRQMAPFTLHMTNGEARIGEVSAGPSGALDVVRGMVQPLALESIGVVRLAIPLVAGDIVTGLSGHIIDAVADGTHIYVATVDAPTGVSDGDRLASVLRLTPR
jgi:hypothetical protein